jgi:uncharacterized protein
MATPPSEWTLPDLRIDADGVWYDGGVEITHAGILANLRSSLRRDDAGYFIQTRVRIPVRVDDVPLLVIRLERREDSLRVWLNDGEEETVDPATIRVRADDVPYCVVKGGAFEARFTRAAAFQLLALAEYDEATGRGALRLAGREYPLSRAS